MWEKLEPEAGLFHMPTEPDSVFDMAAQRIGTHAADHQWFVSEIFQIAAYIQRGAGADGRTVGEAVEQDFAKYYGSLHAVAFFFA